MQFHFQYKKKKLPNQQKLQSLYRLKSIEMTNQYRL